MIEFAVNFSPGADLDVNMGQVMEVYATIIYDYTGE